MARLNEANSLDELTKYKVLDLLGREGYATYRRRLKKIDFYVAYFYKDHYCPAAFMSQKDMCIVINPGFVVDMDKEGPIFKQLSVIVRHELLHFLLCHEKRFYDYLKQTDPDFENTYKRADMNTLANFAMDYELGNYGYDDYDKKVVKNMRLNGRVISGLLSEDVKNDTTSVWGAGLINGEEVYNGVEFNNWENKSMEEMFQMLRNAHEKLMNTQGPKPDDPKNPGDPKDPKKPNEPNPKDPKDPKGPKSGDPQDPEKPGEIKGPVNGPEGEGPEGDGPEGKGPEGEGPEGDGPDGGQGGQGGQNGPKKPGGQGSDGKDDKNDKDEPEGPGHDQISDEFAAAWNEVLKKYDNDEFSPDDLEQIARQIMSGKITSL